MKEEKDIVKQTMNKIRGIVDYEERLSRGCTCTSKYEHERLECVSLEHFIDVSLVEINKLFYGEEDSED